jgi:phosphatidylethanolamine-binding protein (PEBP) family uncharacterized protein
VTLPISLRLPLSALAAGAVLLLGACSGSGTPPVETPAPEDTGPPPSPIPVILPSVPTTFTVTSSAFADGAAIPQAYTCKGEGLIPPLSWSGNLGGGTTIAVVVDDRDGPVGGFVQWLIADLPVTPPAPTDPNRPPDGAHEASNSDGDPGWTPLCPNRGTHHYRFTVYALDGPSGIGDGDDPVRALLRLAPHVKAWGQLTGTVTGS